MADDLEFIHPLHSLSLSLSLRPYDNTKERKKEKSEKRLFIPVADDTRIDGTCWAMPKMNFLNLNCSMGYFALLSFSFPFFPSTNKIQHGRTTKENIITMWRNAFPEARWLIGCFGKVDNRICLSPPLLKIAIKKRMEARKARKKSKENICEVRVKEMLVSALSLSVVADKRRRWWPWNFPFLV